MRSPSRSPRRELETNWGNLVKVAGEIRRHEAIILSDEEPPKAVSRSADIAVRAFRKDGRVWLLAVNKTASPVKGSVSVKGFADVTFELPALGAEVRRAQVRAFGRRGGERHDALPSCGDGSGRVQR